MRLINRGWVILKLLPNVPEKGERRRAWNEALTSTLRDWKATSISDPNLELDFGQTQVCEMSRRGVDLKAVISGELSIRTFSP